jgi:hypothetical protein
MRRRALENVMQIVVTLILAMVVCSLIGCTSTKFVPIETTRSDTLHHHIYVKDSVTHYDSIYVDRYINGDTMRVTTEIVRYRYRDKLKVDTLYINKVDTIATMVEIEKKLTKWQQFKIDAGEWVIGGALLLLAILAVLWVINWRRR